MSELKTSGPRGTLRQRILAFVGALILLSLLGSTISLYRITEVNRSLDAINRVSVPLGRLLTQMQSDADIFHRELERRLGYSHWKDPHWRPRPMPQWIEDVLQNEIERATELIQKDLPWATPETREHWRNWVKALSTGFVSLKGEAAKLHHALEQKDVNAATQIYPRWTASLEEWTRQLHWGANEYERSLRQSFTTAETTVTDLRTGLEIILIVVVSLSLLLLWLGERALRPLEELTGLARQITRRGLRKEDKAALPEIPLSRNDEVSQLAREFHHMATALLEREKTVETQKNRLQEQNRQLREMGELNENILHSIESILIVTDLAGRITQCNPVAASWLGTAEMQVIGTELLAWPKIQSFVGGDQWLKRVKESGEAHKVEPQSVENRVYGGQIMPLKHDKGGADGAIVVLEDLTEELSLQERLRSAEHLAAVGRMSAQVAHEVRNPLHSIGLEAEVAAEMAARIGHPSLKSSLQSILASVDRLEKITENYLKLSRLSSGEKKALNLGEVLESVLATYAPVCEAQGVQVEWTGLKSGAISVWGDSDLLEQVLGNLHRNALQALAEHQGKSPGFSPRIAWHLGVLESGRVWIRIEDNGPGIASEVKERLFTPFVTTRAQGTGLGLSFIKRVIEEHGGTIQSLEPKQGAGAVFEILLPPAAVAVKPPAPPVHLGETPHV